MFNHFSFTSKVFIGFTVWASISFAALPMGTKRRLGFSFSGFDPRQPHKLRIVTGNLSSGNKQSYDLGHGIRLFRAVSSNPMGFPMIGLVQEMKYGNNSNEAMRELTNLAFGDNFHYFREDEAGDHIPNGIVSSLPIDEAGEIDDPVLSNRDLVFARIGHLWAFSLHLSTKPEKRVPQATKLVSAIEKHVPSSDLIVIGGDTNASGWNDRALDILGSIVSTKNRPVDGFGKTGTNSGRSKPYDVVLPSPALEECHIGFELLGDRTYPNGFVLDSRTHEPLSSIKPAQRGDSAAPNMQHMLVGKDFQVPALVPTKRKDTEIDKLYPGRGTPMGRVLLPRKIIWRVLSP